MYRSHTKEIVKTPSDTKRTIYVYCIKRNGCQEYVYKNNYKLEKNFFKISEYIRIKEQEVTDFKLLYL